MRGYPHFSWRKGYRCLLTQTGGSHFFIKDNLLRFNLGKTVVHCYRIYSINRPGRLFNFGPTRLALIRGWVFIIFSKFSVSKDILGSTINAFKAIEFRSEFELNCFCQNVNCLIKLFPALPDGILKMFLLK